MGAVVGATRRLGSWAEAYRSSQQTSSVEAHGNQDFAKSWPFHASSAPRRRPESATLGSAVRRPETASLRLLSESGSRSRYVDPRALVAACEVLRNSHVHVESTDFGAPCSAERIMRVLLLGGISDAIGVDARYIPAATIVVMSQVP